MNNLPYSDEYMIYDQMRGRYILTESALESEGIYLRARLSRSPMINVTNVISGFCRTVSTHVYNYVHQFARNVVLQDKYIAEDPCMRIIIYNAMIEQAKHVIANGDLSLSADENRRRAYFSPSAASLIIDSGLAYTG